MIVIGTDTHKRSHALAAVDEGTGRVRGQREIKAEDAGHLAAVRWARGLNEERVWAIEDCRHVSRRLEQALLAAGERVVRVAPHRMGASRKRERERGKSDEIDALAIARAVVKDGVERFPVAYLNEEAMEIRLLLDHRNDLVAERTRTVNRLRWHLLELCPELEGSLKRGALNQARVLERVDRRLRKLPAGARVRITREQIARLRGLNRRIDALQHELAELVKAPPSAAVGGDGLSSGGGRNPDRPHRRPRAVPLGRELRAAVRHGADPMLLGPAHAAPAQPRRGPPAPPRAARDRDHPRAARPRYQGVPRPQGSRGEDQQGSAALPQAPPRAPLPPPALPTCRAPSTRSEQRRRPSRRYTPAG
jgi:transposase